MATSPWYRSGTAKFTNGSTTVTGTDTEWVKFVRAGDGIQGPDGKLYQITNVSSNTSLSIFPAYGGDTSYWTIPIQGYVKQLADTAAQLVRDFEGGAVEALDAADRAKQSAIDAETQKNEATAEADRAGVEADRAGVEAGRAESEADRAEQEADRAQQAADDAVAVVTGGDASIEPEAGKIPLAGASGTIKQSWIENLQFELDAIRVARNKLMYGDGPYPVLDFQFQGAKYLDPRIEFTRASLDWDEEGNEYGIDEPVLTGKGLWVSGSRTNFLKSSGDQTQTPWGSVGVSSSISSEPPGIAGRIPCLIENNSGGVGRVGQSFELSSVQERVSLTAFVKWVYGNQEVVLRLGAADRMYATFNLQSGEIVKANPADSATMERLPNGFVKLTLSGLHGFGPETTTTQFRVQLNEDSGILLNGTQLESGCPSSYIPTENSQVTVAETTVSLPVSNFALSNFSIISSYAEIITGGRYPYQYLWGMSSLTSTSNYVGARLRDSNRGLALSTSSGTISERTIESSVMFGASISKNNISQVVNGGTISSLEIVNPLDFSVMPYLFIGGLTTSESFKATGFCKSIAIHKTILSEQQLQELTS